MTSSSSVARLQLAASVTHTPPWDGLTGTRTRGCTPRWTTFRQQNSNSTTTLRFLRLNRRCHTHEDGTKRVTVHCADAGLISRSLVLFDLDFSKSNGPTLFVFPNKNYYRQVCSSPWQQMCTGEPVTYASQNPSNAIGRICGRIWLFCDRHSHDSGCDSGARFPAPLRLI